VTLADTSQNRPDESDIWSHTGVPGVFAKLADGRVYYELAGPPDARTVVLIPGLSVPCFIWDPTFDALVQAGFRVLRYDLYGRGHSDRPDVPYDQALYDRQLVGLLDVLEIERPVDVVGLSLGGAIAVVFADRHPESVRRLCLIDPAGLPWKQRAAAKAVEIPILGDWIMSLVGRRVLVSGFRDYFSGEEADSEAVARFEEQFDRPGFRRAVLSTLRQGVVTGAMEAYDRLGHRDFPVLLIWGREDTVVPFELNERVQELVPQAEFHAVDRAAHIPHYERPEVVNPLLIDFLAR
jgi:pimeloyl-ACP methyl ester carboxylesterase